MKRPLLPTQAVAGLTILVVATLFISVFALLFDLRSREIEHSRIETLSLTEMLLDQTEQIFRGADLVLLGVQGRLQSSFGKQLALDSLPVHILLGARVASMKQARSLFIVSAEGEVINSSREHPIRNFDTKATDRDYYQYFAQGGREDLYIGKPVVSRADGSWTMHIARRLRNADGDPIAILVISLNLDNLTQLYSFAKLDFIRPISLYLADGTLVASLPERRDLLGKVAPELAKTPIPAVDAPLVVHTRLDARGRKENYTLARIDDLPLLISVADPQVDALAAWRETAQPIAYGSLAIAALIVGVALLLIRQLHREAGLNRALRDADDRYLETVESTNRQLRELSAALQDVREEERSRISRELHDDLGQQLTGLKLDLAWLATRIREGRPTDPERVGDMRKLLDRVIASVRQISSDLRPPVLDDLGFCEAVRWLAEEMARRSGITIEVSLPAGQCVEDRKLGTAMFRIVQEALTNIVRHAEASHVFVWLVAEPERLALIVRDDGKGTDIGEGPGGIGLLSMRERVVSLGGELVIMAAPGQGVTIEASFPQPPARTEPAK